MFTGFSFVASALHICFYNNEIAALQVSVFLVQLLTISLNLVSFNEQVGLVVLFCMYPDILTK